MVDQHVPLHHPKLPDVHAFSLDPKEPRRDKPQQILVVCAPMAQIPLHHHEHDASMFIVAGGGQVLASDPKLNGKDVRIGCTVFFPKGQDHGFQAGPEGLNFISTNGGIVDDNPRKWDIAFAS